MTRFIYSLSLAAVFALPVSVSADPVPPNDTPQINMAQINITVAGMTCPFCVATSEKALKSMAGVHAVSSELKSGLISVCLDPSVNLDDDSLSRLFKDKGFTFKSAERLSGCVIEGYETPAEVSPDGVDNTDKSYGSDIHYGSGSD